MTLIAYSVQNNFSNHFGYCETCFLKIPCCSVARRSVSALINRPRPQRESVEAVFTKNGFLWEEA